MFTTARVICPFRRPCRNHSLNETPSAMTQRFSAFLLLLPLLLLRPSDAAAQEFNCSVTLNIGQLSGSDYGFLEELRERVFEYMNNRRWTEDRFDDEERIVCSISIVFTEAVTLSRFRARLVLATNRPIYGSAQNTYVMQLADTDWQFEYSQGTPLIFQPDQYHPLTSVLDFYAYTMLGFDYDTFSDHGGQPHFEKARRIADIAQTQGALGWSSMGGDQSRGELISQIMDPRFDALRTAYFDFHFGCLDHFVDRPDEARQVALATVQKLQALREDVTRAYYLDQFFASKYSELVNVFRGSPEASQAFDALSKIDPAHIAAYSDMMN
ncbi:MAG: DUF4835 family protein [Bacteroidetes bacterium]|nr:DUF4835 family protein [Bacteroidota bacterium]